MCSNQYDIQDFVVGTCFQEIRQWFSRDKLTTSIVQGCIYNWYLSIGNHKSKLETTILSQYVTDTTIICTAKSRHQFIYSKFTIQSSHHISSSHGHWVGIAIGQICIAPDCKRQCYRLQEIQWTTSIVQRYTHSYYFIYWKWLQRIKNCAVLLQDINISRKTYVYLLYLNICSM